MPNRAEIPHGVGGSGGTQDTFARERGVVKGCAFCSESEVGMIDRTRTMKVSSGVVGHVRKLVKLERLGCYVAPSLRY